MTQSSNILTFPTVTAGKAPTSRAIPEMPGELVDLSSRRTATSARPQAMQPAAPAAGLTAGDVWTALADERVTVHYQPQYDMVTGQTVAAEALVRLIDTEGELVYPDRFIEMVEQSDLIVPLGRAVIEQACADLAACRASGIELRRIALNLSARQCNVDTGLVDFVEQMIARHALSYDDLEFELTERQRLTPDCEGLAAIRALAERGARMVIDDFGIGYSSIVYLTELPISAFKLDRALVGRLPEDTTMQSVVQSLLALAEDLDLEVVAEGVETNAQNDYLAGAGCPYAQGFGFAKPMSIFDLQVFMTNGGSASQPGLLLLQD